MKYNKGVFVDNKQEGSDLFKSVEGAADTEPNPTRNNPTQPVFHMQFPPGFSTHAPHSSGFGLILIFRSDLV